MPTVADAQLWQAAADGKMGCARRALRAGASVNTRDAATSYLTPLCVAAMNGHLDMCRLLVQCKADVNLADEDDCTPLFLAAENGEYAVCRLLITKGRADTNKADKEGATPLLIAAAEGNAIVCRLLLTTGGTDVNKAEDLHGITPLLLAALYGDVELCRLMVVEAKADITQTTKLGNTAVHFAAQHGHADACRFLVREGRADVHSTNNDGRTPLSMAAGGGHADTCRVLVLECGADVNVKDANAEIGVLQYAVRSNDLDVCRVLLSECGADVNSADINGCTSLFDAAFSNQIDMCRMLVDEFGADVNRKRRFGDTALMGATIRKHHKIVRFLVKRGAQPGVYRRSDDDAKAMYSDMTMDILLGSFRAEDGLGTAITLSDAAAATRVSFMHLASSTTTTNRTLNTKLEDPKERARATARRNAVMAYLARKRCTCCGELADTKACARCRAVAYCSKDCQAKHWRMHRSDCYAETSTSSAASRPRAADAKLSC